MKLVKPNDPVLLKPCERFSFEDPPIDPFELVEEMKKVMIENKGIGLSANQVGLPYQVFLMGHFNQPDEILACFNSNIVDRYGEEFYTEEGCLSFPGLFIKIKRYSNIRIRFANETGNVETHVMDGIAARVAQHEYDHGQGITYQSLASRLHLQQAKKQKEKLDRLRKRNMRQMHV